MICVRSFDQLCLSASLASIFHLSIDSVPRFHGGINRQWGVQKWQFHKFCIKQLGVRPVWWDISATRGYLRDRYVIGTTRKHAVVVLNGEVVWDPSLLGTEMTQIDEICSFIAMPGSGNGGRLISLQKFTGKLERLY
jgi:hypothetical protein